MKKVLMVVAITLGFLALVATPILMIDDSSNNSAYAQDKTVAVPQGATTANTEMDATKMIEDACNNGIALLKQDGQPGFVQDIVVDQSTGETIADKTKKACVDEFTDKSRPHWVIACMRNATDRRTFTACDTPDPRLARWTP